MNEEPLEPTPLAYQDLEPFLEAQVADPLPEGLVDPSWLREPEIEQDWLQVVEQEPIDASLDTPSLHSGWDLEH
jgi:hypothetical protein